MENFSFVSLWIVLGLAMSFILPSLTIDSNFTIEDQFIQRYGNRPPILRRWHPLRQVFFNEAIRHKKMTPLCETCHRLAGKGSLDTEHLVHSMYVRQVAFRNTTYNSFFVEMVWYMVYEKNKTKAVDMHYYNFMEGLGAGCVFYLTPAKELRTYYLDQHVCGVPYNLLNKKPIHTPELVPA